jgi:cation:H+ antiporter
MPIPDFRALSVWTNVAVFAGAAVVVWLAGTRLAYYADAISERTKLSKAFVGLILLGVATSLPEIVTTITGALLDNAPLVAGNLFGGVALQITILAIVDMVAMRRALTFFTPQPVLLFQGVMLLLLLSIALAGAAAGDPLSLAGFGLTPLILVAGYIATVNWSRPGDDRLPRWRATNAPGNEDAASQREQASSGYGDYSNGRLFGVSALAGVVILAAGWALAQTGDALSQQTGLGASFVGVALVAASTSLPELSTALAAVRQGNHQMAVSNILGTNCLGWPCCSWRTRRIAAAPFWPRPTTPPSSPRRSGWSSPASTWSDSWSAVTGHGSAWATIRSRCWSPTAPVSSASISCDELPLPAAASRPPVPRVCPCGARRREPRLRL